MTNPSISVVTIARNNRDELVGTLQSVFEQDYPDIELIVVDGASSDGSPEFLRSLKRERFQWISEPDQGRADACNKGVALANGDLVLVLPAGDLFVDEHTVSQAIELLRDLPHLTESIVYGDYYYLFEGECKVVTTDHGRLLWDCGLNLGAAFIGRNVAHRFQFDPRLEVGNDYDLWLRCLAAKVPFVKIGMPIVKYPVGGISNTLNYRVHVVILYYFLVALNTKHVLTVGDIFKLCFHAVGEKIDVTIRKIVGRRVIRALKRLLRK